MAISSRHPRVLLGAVLAVFALGAEETSTLEIAVRVEPAVQAASFPAQVLIGFESANGGFLVFRVGFVCTPDALFSSTVTFETSGAPTAVDAFLLPVPPGATVVCGPLAPPQAVSSSAEPLGAPRASAGLVVAAGCSGGDTRTATVVIAGSQ